MRKNLLLERLKKMMVTSTNTANPKLRTDPKVPLSIAVCPPPHEVMPALMRHKPMSVTTMPATSGVMTLRV